MERDLQEIHVFISGRVQGVFFRKNTKIKADKLGLAGWVKNLPDGRVEAVFIGKKEKLKQMLDWCWRGSWGARVDNLEIAKKTAKKDLKGFKIKK